MKDITSKMIKQFDMINLGYDFMGYTFDQKSDLSFHHLIVPKRYCKEQGLGKGFYFWNGAILNAYTSHAYLHTIENIDHDMFLAITSEMIDENILRSIQISNLKRIRDILISFEREYCSETNKKGDYIIKPSYTEQRISLR